MIKWEKDLESADRPKMMEIYHNKAWQNAFCYACAVEPSEHEWQGHKLLLAIIAGSDSTIQAMKAAIDIGGHGLAFGYGEKTLTDYTFISQFRIFSEKGKYEKFPMTINHFRKALAVIHDDLLGNGRYILSFAGDPAEDLRQLLGGGKFGLHILPEWKDLVFQEFLQRRVIEPVEFYCDEALFPKGFHIYKLNVNEDEELAELEVDEIIASMIKDGRLPFPGKGDGRALVEIKDLTSYMERFVDDMIRKVSEKVNPVHDPMNDHPHPQINVFKRELFPVQAHVSTALAKVLQKQKVALIQGEMSTGKTSMMTAVPEILAAMSGKSGYFACVLCPPSLTKKWPDEIRELLPHADVHVIERTEDIVRFHVNWLRIGRPKPKKPTFFVISFTTMRGDSAIVPAVNFKTKKTRKQREENRLPYRYGFYCPRCGKPHQVIESSQVELNDNGEEVVVYNKRTMNEDEFGTTRRLHNGAKPANAFCSECGESLWTKKVPTRYSSFREWAKFERCFTRAILDGNMALAQQIALSQPEIPKQVGCPRRVAAAEYMRRRMKNFFDVGIVDEIHQLKAGMSAQGLALSNLMQASKKIIGGTGTLFGGKAEDVYYLLWRLFPRLMVVNGYKYSQVRKWNEEYGNIETTIYSQDQGEYSNKQSRGGIRKTEKVLPGISPFVFSKFLIQNTVLVRLADVWPDPVELVDVPTILVDLDSDLRNLYQKMVDTFKKEIDERADGYKLYLPLTQTGIAYPDNPFTYPAFAMKTEDGDRELIWEPEPFPKDRILNKEKKLQEIVKGEISEGRKSIVYVRDTGSSVEGRDIRPRLKMVLEQIGAKVCILDTSTTETNRRSEWLEKKIVQEGYDVCIVSQELVQVGLDLICTPTLIFYQFSWSLFVHNQASRRAWRIGQTEECRLYYLAYRDTYQEQMATLIAQKNKAASAINGEVSNDGINAMLGDDGDLQSLLIQHIKKGDVLKGSTEEWVAAASDRARAILAGLGKKTKQPSLKEQFIAWVHRTIQADASKNVLIRRADSITEHIAKGGINGFAFNNNVLEVDLIDAFGIDPSFVMDGEIVAYLMGFEKAAKPQPIAIETVEVKTNHKRKRRKEPIDGQLAFVLWEG
ncbi:DEAD/DEAH box helicase [Parageobacillus thermoglucosidasius]|uniref:DEAD/DEAH box helicase n=1 Tax=Parageobacillus thermoglucosidasius TaxID=1426 RepID=UPI000B57DF7C|nr:DEAD/DEAH box helicase [Parageobacillus thermoglucosidasius]OUM90433.1 MAG: helicase [Parageobacillus thermoglucosidasius]